MFTQCNGLVKFFESDFNKLLYSLSLQEDILFVANFQPHSNLLVAKFKIETTEQSILKLPKCFEG